jgi:hypothetical protein
MTPRSPNRVRGRLKNKILGATRGGEAVFTMDYIVEARGVRTKFAGDRT